jgi:hypothetical protein
MHIDTGHGISLKSPILSDLAALVDPNPCRTMDLILLRQGVTDGVTLAPLLRHGIGTLTRSDNLRDHEVVVGVQVVGSHPQARVTREALDHDRRRISPSQVAECRVPEVVEAYVSLDPCPANCGTECIPRPLHWPPLVVEKHVPFDVASFDLLAAQCSKRLLKPRDKRKRSRPSLPGTVLISV